MRKKVLIKIFVDRTGEKIYVASQKFVVTGGMQSELGGYCLYIFFLSVIL